MSVCVLVTWASCAKTAEPTEMAFAGLTHVGPKNHVLDGGSDQTNTFAMVRGVNMVMWPFAKLLWTLVLILVLAN